MNKISFFHDVWYTKMPWITDDRVIYLQTTKSGYISLCKFYNNRNAFTRNQHVNSVCDCWPAFDDTYVYINSQSLTYPFRRCYLQTETLPGEMTWKYRKVLFFAGPCFRISWYFHKHPVQNQCYLIISGIKKSNFVYWKTAKKQCVWQPAGGPGARTAGDWKDV